VALCTKKASRTLKNNIFFTAASGDSSFLRPFFADFEANIHLRMRKTKFYPQFPAV
jgi:hypothetical protein